MQYIIKNHRPFYRVQAKKIFLMCLHMAKILLPLAWSNQKDFPSVYIAKIHLPLPGPSQKDFDDVYC